MCLLIDSSSEIRNEFAKTFNDSKDNAFVKIEDKLKKIYKDKLIDIKKEEILPTFTFDVNYLDSEYDVIYKADMPTESERGGHPYYLPIGFRRLAIKVLGLYENDNWINKTDSNGWAVAFHGITGDDPLDSMEKIVVQGKSTGKAFNSAKKGRRRFGKGVYCAPDYHIAESYFNKDGLSAKLMTTKGIINYIILFQ